MVRGYNGGPQGATKTSTVAYWNKYLQAKQSLPNTRLIILFIYFSLLWAFMRITSIIDLF